VLAELAASAAAELTRSASWRVAVSRRHAGPLGISRCYAEALEALKVADRLGIPDRVVHARQLLVYRVLLRDESAMTDLVEAVLGPLTVTAEGPDRLLRTLEAYFGAGGNTTAAARKLHLSVRALTYRLQRVHELTGYRAGDPGQQLTLSVAVTGARLLDWPHHSALATRARRRARPAADR
jgi:DNA-binding PucR family transcriptional regulator